MQSFYLLSQILVPSGMLHFSPLFFLFRPVVYSNTNRWLGLLLTSYEYFSCLAAKFEGYWSLYFLYEIWNSVRGPIFEIFKGILDMFPRLYTNYFSIFCHSFWNQLFLIISHCALILKNLLFTHHSYQLSKNVLATFITLCLTSLGKKEISKLRSFAYEVKIRGAVIIRGIILLEWIR